MRKLSRQLTNACDLTGMGEVMSMISSALELAAFFFVPGELHQ